MLRRSFLPVFFLGLLHSLILLHVTGKKNMIWKKILVKSLVGAVRSVQWLSSSSFFGHRTQNCLNCLNCNYSDIFFEKMTLILAISYL